MNTQKQPREIPFFLAILPILIMITVMAFSIIKLDASPHVPLLIGAIVAGMVVVILGKPLKKVFTTVLKWRCPRLSSLL